MRALGVGLAQFVFFANTFIEVTFIVTPAFTGLGPGGAPLLFAGTNVVSLLIVIAFVPETNNKSLETLDLPAEPQSDARSLKVVPGPDVVQM